jgi:hypothetical protein
MTSSPPIAVRVLVEIVAFPVRIVAALVGVLAVIAGALGTIAWTIQLLIGGNGGGPLPDGLMWLCCLGAVPAGLMMLQLSTILGVEHQLLDPTARNNDHEHVDECDGIPDREDWDLTVVGAGNRLSVRAIHEDELDYFLTALAHHTGQIEIEAEPETRPAYHRRPPQSSRGGRRPL